MQVDCFLLKLQSLCLDVGRNWYPEETIQSNACSPGFIEGQTRLRGLVANGDTLAKRTLQQFNLEMTSCST